MFDWTFQKPDNRFSTHTQNKFSDESQCGVPMYSMTSKHRALVSCMVAMVTSRTSPARLGLPLIEEVAELSELMEEALGLLFRVDLLFEVLALVGVVQGKPIRVTLWTGANRPYLGMHWKYLRAKKSFVLGYSTTDDVCKFIICRGSSPGPRYSTVVLAKWFI